MVWCVVFDCKIKKYIRNTENFFLFFYLRMSEKSRTFALVIEIGRHIEILLLANDCVIVPGLGGFMAHHVDARYDMHDGMFVPPIRTLGFNPQLTMNDSLLVQSYIEAYDISYPAALRRIEDEVTELRAHLEASGEYVLHGIGTLTLNDEGHLAFEPCEAGILTPSLYGLSSFEMPRLDHKEQKSRRALARQLSLPVENVITIKMSWLRNIVAVAAAVIAFFMIGTPVSNSSDTDDVQQSSFLPVSSHHRPPLSQTDVLSPTATEDTDPTAVAEVPSPFTAETAAIEPGSFCIVMASQVTEHNAQLYIAQLQEKGYGEARMLVTGKMRRVIYGGYPSADDAYAALQQLRKESRLFRETWIMEVK